MEANMPRSMSISSLRRRASALGYRLVKARAIRWEGTQWTDPYRLIDLDSGFIAAGFDGPEDVQHWLED